MSIYDTYRVVLTRVDGMQIPTSAKTHESAMAYFTGALAGETLAEGVRLRVISEKTWLEAGGPR